MNGRCVSGYCYYNVWMVQARLLQGLCHVYLNVMASDIILHTANGQWLNLPKDENCSLYSTFYR